MYFGVGALNMRALASGAFGPGDVVGAVQFCHDAGVRAYLALNTVIFERDLPEMQALLETAAGARVDAVIASDMAVVAASRALGLRVHLSTQMNIANSAALKFYARDADVAVLARELTLKEVAQIARIIRQENIRGPSGGLLRLEMFCHGALCMAQSGRCYMSLHTRGKSAKTSGPGWRPRACRSSRSRAGPGDRSTCGPW